MNFKKYLENLDHSKSDIHKIITYSEKLIKIVKDQDLEDWVKAKLTHAEDYLNIALDYVKYYKVEQTEQKNKMSVGNLKSIKSKAEELDKLLNNMNELKDWVKSKLNLAGEYLDDIYHHLDYKRSTE
jgi:small nuclear ribonucleoprotein (snRNP)-like protein